MKSKKPDILNPQSPGSSTSSALASACVAAYTGLLLYGRGGSFTQLLALLSLAAALLSLLIAVRCWLAGRRST